VATWSWTEKTMASMGLLDRLRQAASALSVAESGWAQCG
jgi:hypothetical protein